MGSYFLLMWLVMGPNGVTEQPKCDRRTRATVWPRDWLAAKECEKVEMCTCGPSRCGWKAVTIPMWVLAGSPRPASCEAPAAESDRQIEVPTGQ